MAPFPSPTFLTLEVIGDVQFDLLPGEETIAASGAGTLDNSLLDSILAFRRHICT